MEEKFRVGFAFAQRFAFALLSTVRSVITCSLGVVVVFEGMNLISRLRSLAPSFETIDGYEHPELIEVVFQKTKSYQPKEIWPETAKTVLDFGGGCGLHYKAAPADTRWAVVETPAMAKRASELATDKLQFFTSIQEAADWLGSIDLMHSNSALQYTLDPETILRELCALGAQTMLWRRLSLSTDRTESEMQTSRLTDNGPGRLGGFKNKVVRYRITRIPEELFLSCHRSYRLLERSPDSFRFVR